MNVRLLAAVASTLLVFFLIDAPRSDALFIPNPLEAAKKLKAAAARKLAQAKAAAKRKLALAKAAAKRKAAQLKAAAARKLALAKAAAKRKAAQLAAAAKRKAAALKAAAARKAAEAKAVAKRKAAQLRAAAKRKAAQLRAAAKKALAKGKGAFEKVGSTLKKVFKKVGGYAMKIWSWLKKLPGKVKKFAGWAYEKWQSTAKATKNWFKGLRGKARKWWKSCGVCNLLPMGKSSCRNVCRILRKSYKREKPTRYPVVLLHGVMDAPVGSYFYGVPEYLGKHGFRVFHKGVGTANTTWQRLGTLRKFVLSVLRKTRSRKVHLLGHSQGGIDGRTLASDRALRGKIATVTTVQTPHRGSACADFLAPIAKKLGRFGRSLLNRVLAVVFPGTSGAGKGGIKGVMALTTKAMARYNRRVKNVRGVKYFSFSGSACATGTTRRCKRHVHIGLFNDFWTTAKKTGDQNNDAQVSHKSAKWGLYVGDYRADHWNGSGIPFGITNFNYLNLYRDLVRGLRCVETGKDACGCFKLTAPSYKRSCRVKTRRRRRRSRRRNRRRSRRRSTRKSPRRR